jgi:hypothetical protein
MTLLNLSSKKIYVTVWPPVLWHPVLWHPVLWPPVLWPPVLWPSVLWPPVLWPPVLWPPVLWQDSRNFSPNVFHIRALKENSCLDQRMHDKPHSNSVHWLVYYINPKFQSVSVRFGVKHCLAGIYRYSLCYPKSANGNGNRSALSGMLRSVWW